MTLYKYWSSACPKCPMRTQCTTGKYRRIARWEHEQVLETMQARLEQMPQASRVRRQTVEHTFGTLKSWSLHVLAYNLQRAMQILGVVPLMQAMRA